MTDPIREAFERHIVGDDDRIDYTRTLSRNPATDEYLSCEVEEAWTWYQKGRADLLAEQQAAQPEQPHAVTFEPDEWDEVQGHLLAALEMDDAHKAAAFQTYAIGLMEYIDELRAQPAITDRVALTDEQIEAVWQEWLALPYEGNGDMPAFARMIERALLERK